MTALTAALAAIDAATDPNSERNLARAKELRALRRLSRRKRLITAIIEVTEYPRLFEDHRYFRDCFGAVLSPEEAVEKCRDQIVREHRKIARQHWSAKPERISGLREAMTFARFMRARHARELLAVEVREVA
jgi:hypothetical protein